MELKFVDEPRELLLIDGAKIVYRNFAGAASKFNRAGDRNFAVIIPTQEMVDELVANGWNVKSKPPRDEDDTPFMYLPVKIKFNDRGPKAYLVSGDNVVELNEDTIDCIDEIDIVSVDVDIRPYDWEVNGKTGRTAYLEAIRVFQNLDRFAAEYANR
jgi:hypothetical protein